MKNRADFQVQVSNLIEASVATKKAMLGDAQIVATIAKVCELLVNALSQGNKILLFGNGGSAADAQHLAAELVGRFAFDRPALPALSLSVNTSCLTAIFSTAKKMGLHTIALTGKTGGKLRGSVDHCVCVPSDETPRIQECHGLIGHILSELVEHAIFDHPGSRPKFPGRRK